MPTFDLPLPVANSIYNVSFTVLAGSTVLMFFSAIGLIWSGLARERHAAEKATSLASIATQAEAAAEKAKADLAEADRQLALANAATAVAQKEASDAKAGTSSTTTSAPAAGREVSAGQKDLFKTFIQNYSKGKVIVASVGSNTEAASYAREIAGMLQESGYMVLDKTGSYVPAIGDPVGVQMKIKSMVEQPLYAGSLQRGLEYIGIDTTGQLDDAAEDGVLIFVGNKP